MISNNKAIFKAISESQLAMTAALTNLAAGSQAVHVGSTVVVLPVTEPRITFVAAPQAVTKEDQAKFLSVAQVAAVKL